MAVKKFQTDAAKYKNGISDIYNPFGNTYEKKNQEKVNRMESVKETFRQYASFWREYPDIFIDMVTPKDSKFKLFFYQRIFLRICMRYRYVYATFTRAFSKSFLSILALYLKCIFFPGIKLFICSGGKEQAANIAKEKIEELWDLFPILHREIKYHQFTKDYVKLVFQNGSKLDIVAVQNSTRGGRRHAGLIEETILVDGQKLSEVIIPLMNVDRRAKNGEVDPNEPHKSQIYVTTAGYKNTFAYQKMVQLLAWMIVKENAFVFGGDWRIPVKHQLLSENFVEELKEDGTYNPLSFSREYESLWTGSSEDAFFDAELFDKHRKIFQPEFEPDKNKDVIYIVAADVARSIGAQNADTVALIIKCIPRDNGSYLKQIVNLFTFDGEHFLEQSIKLKKLVFQFNASMLVVDANGVGKGLVDFLIKENVDEISGDIYVPFSVVNDDRYDEFKTKDSLPLLYNVLSQGIASDIHVNCLSQISSGKVKFLIDEMTAKSKIINTKKGKDMNSEKMAEYLSPFIKTSIMKDEMMNLRSEHQGNSVILKQISRRIGKDKFSSLEYGLWYIKGLEDKNINRSKINLYDYMFFKYN
ncbi:DNA-packaging protein [Heyndrickxia oleronia]|jgi:hypothetical protein|uniref:DNA-packaging protein n=1 Tax=Heyndrickxia oleronia TaxID=38875 RepID=UPI00242FA162|nr:DNA-packaging protein [Heyndrickxia oleronia]MCI1763647.1 DNA-packaging protein [Heyndrickxia oleronia]